MDIINKEGVICGRSHTLFIVLSSTEDTGSGEIKISATSRRISSCMIDAQCQEMQSVSKYIPYFILTTVINLTNAVAL